MRHEPLSHRTNGRWSDILSAIGLPSKALSGKHGPCPICGGKDRFRFDNKRGAGTFFCSQCGPGDGVELVKLFKGVDFKSAAALIEQHIGVARVDPPHAALSDEKRRELMNKLWLSSRPIVNGDPVARYLFNRIGVVSAASVLRFVDRCRYQDEAPSFHPAMIAMVQDADGEPCQLHRTYLTPDGAKASVQAPRRLMPGAVKPGSAVRLAAHGDGLGIAEGIETALSATAIFGVPCWAALNTTLLAQWMPPEGIKSVTIFADHDKGFAGQRAAYELAYRISGKVQVSVQMPDTPGYDWNDVLRAGMKEAA
jgi:putative DNA primase/helicase